MRGHQPLIAMRLAGKCPSAVYMDVGADPTQAWKTWPGSNPWSEIAHVEIPDGDKLSSLPPQLRFLVGLPVKVTGTNRDRTEAVAQMAMEAGAQSVFVLTSEPETNATRHAAYITKDMTEWRSF